MGNEENVDAVSVIPRIENVQGMGMGIEGIFNEDLVEAFREKILDKVASMERNPTEKEELSAIVAGLDEAAPKLKSELQGLISSLRILAAGTVDDSVIRDYSTKIEAIRAHQDEIIKMQEKAWFFLGISRDTDEINADCSYKGFTEESAALLSKEWKDFPNWQFLSMPQRTALQGSLMGMDLTHKDFYSYLLDIEISRNILKKMKNDLPVPAE